MARIRKKIKAVPRVGPRRIQTVEAPVKVVAPPDESGNTAEALPVSPLSTAQTKAVVNELMIDGWPIRRRVMFVALAFCMGNVQYLLIWGDDTALNKEIATTLLWVMAAIVGTYVFGAVWDDMNRRDTMMDYGSPYNSGHHHLDQGNE